MGNTVCTCSKKADTKQEVDIQSFNNDNIVQFTKEEQSGITVETINPQMKNMYKAKGGKKDYSYLQVYHFMLIIKLQRYLRKLKRHDLIVTLSLNIIGWWL